MFSALGSCVQVEEYKMDAYFTMIASGAASVASVSRYQTDDRSGGGLALVRRAVEVSAR